LPAGFVAAPGVHLGTEFEIDVSAYEQDEPTAAALPGTETGGVAIAVHAPPHPTLTVETEFPDQDEYEVRIYDERHGRRLVAAIELISPSNKNAASRRAFVGRVAALLLRDDCVSLVDVVTIRQFSLYVDLLEFIGAQDADLAPEPPFLYAATIRARKRPRQRSVADIWFYTMRIGQPLPALPIWLDVDLSVTLDLESSYEETRRYLHIS
jgi:hypothetical protein